MLAVVGYFINNSLQQNQQALDKIKFSDQMITEVFDTSNVEKSMARVELLPEMVTDKKFVTTLTNLVVNFWLEKAKEAASEGNDSVFEKIYTASKTFKQEGKVLMDSIEKDPMTKRAKNAYVSEQLGLHYLQLGKLDSAKKNFTDAVKEHKEFHSAQNMLNILNSYSLPNKEIKSVTISHIKHGNMLNENPGIQPEIKPSTDSAALGQDILGKIKAQYSWKFHAAKPNHKPIPLP